MYSAMELIAAAETFLDKLPRFYDPGARRIVNIEATAVVAFITDILRAAPEHNKALARLQMLALKLNERR